MAVSNCSAPLVLLDSPAANVQPQEERHPQLGGDEEQIVNLSKNALLKGFQL